MQPGAPPSLSDPERDLFTRIVLAEARNQGPQGMAAVASVIKNRMASGKFGGNSAFDVITAKHQFEPMAYWGTGKGNDPSLIDPSSQRYQQASQLVDGVMGGQVADPTGGATNFLNKSANIALGRGIPDWAKGQGLQIGDHTFFGGANGGGTSALGYSPSMLDAGSTPTPSSGASSAAPQASLAALLQAIQQQQQQPAQQRRPGILGQFLFGDQGLQGAIRTALPHGIFGGLAQAMGGAGQGSIPSPMAAAAAPAGPKPIGAPFPLQGSMAQPVASLYNQQPDSPPTPPMRPASLDAQRPAPEMLAQGDDRNQQFLPDPRGAPEMLAQPDMRNQVMPTPPQPQAPVAFQQPAQPPSPVTSNMSVLQNLFGGLFGPGSAYAGQ